MEGEFDREMEEYGAWRPLSVQLQNLMLAAGTVAERKDKDKKLEEIRQQVEQLVRRKGKQMCDKLSLGAWLWQQKKECEVKVEELIEQAKQASVLQKPKLKKKAKLQDGERRTSTSGKD